MRVGLLIFAVCFLVVACDAPRPRSNGTCIVLKKWYEPPGQKLRLNLIFGVILPGEDDEDYYISARDITTQDWRRVCLYKEDWEKISVGQTLNIRQLRRKQDH